MKEQIKPPLPEIVNDISNILEERGVFIPNENVEITTAALCHWLTSSRRGQEYMAYLMQLDSVPGRNEKNYLEKDGFGRLTKEIKPENIIFLRGCIVNGETYPINQIEISDREKESCESCNCSTVCVQSIQVDYGPPVKLCSHCAKADENLEIRDSIEVSCDTCTDNNCSWHPVNVDAPPFECASF